MKHLFTIFLLFLINLHLSHQEDKLLVQRVKTTVNTISLQWQAPKKIAITSGLRPPQMMVYHYQLSDGSEPLNSHNIPWSSKGVKIGLSSDQSTGSAIIENLRPNSKYLIKVEDDKMNETLIVETKDGCFHNSSVYSVGDKFNISCDQICVCQSNSTLTCKDRCQHKPNSASDGCSEKPDPKDPQCCVIHQCEDDKITVIRPKVLITGRTKTSVQIAWDDFKLPNYESGYVIEYKSLNVTSNSTVNDTTTTVSDDWIQIQGNNTPFWTISGLKPNSSYAIRIGLWEDPSERSKIVDSGRSEIITAQTEDGCLRGNISYALRKEIIEGCESRCICMGGDRWNCLPVCADPLIDKGTNKDPTCTEIAVDDCCSTVTCIESRNEPISPNGAGPNDLTFSDKPGNCYEPVNIRSETGICLEECQHDYHCRGLDKCCPTSCGGSVCSQTNTGSASKKCESIVCGQNALCIESRNSSELPKCACKPGYRGDPNDLTNGCRKANSRSNLVCEYKNVTYGPGEEFFDGCAFKCICSEALEIECNPRCPFMTPMDSITTVDPLCTVIQDPKDPCCKMVACESKSVETISVNSTTTMMLTLSSSLANETGFIGETSSVNSPLSIDGCRHDNITYQAGESFVSGCESRCICKEGGHLQCKPRCPVFQGYDQKFCRLIPDPDDPECCKIAVCDTSSLSTSSPSSASTPSMLNSKKVEPFDLILDSAKVLNATFMTLRLIIPNSVHHKANHIFNVRYSKVNMESLPSTESSQQRSWSSFQAGEDDLRLLEPGMFEIDFNGLEPSTEYYVEINEKNSNSTSNRVFIKTFPVGVDSSFNGCFFNNQIIQVGAEFYDGCEYKCICREGGTRECEDRCPVYIDTIGFEECEWSPSPDDPCCTIPVCNKPKETSKDMGSSDSDNDTADPSASSSSTSSSAPVEPFCLGKDDRLHFIGEAWDESGPGGCLKQTCRCVQLANKTTTIRCHGGCAPIPPNAMKATTDCPKPHLVQPDDPCLCPYVICDHGEGDESNSNPQSSSGQTSGSKLSSPSTSPPHMVIRPPMGSTSDLTPGFCRFNGQTVPKGKFNDGCRAVCECLPSGKVECGPLNCPNLFETPTEECLEWELDPNFIPEPPNCCPRPTCKNDGSCIFAGLRFPNFKPIPTELLPCGTRCVCMNSNVTCENRCPTISDIPPPNLPCPPPLAYRGHLPNDDCCLHWMCRDFERSAFCVQNGNRYKIGEQWEDANPINVLGPRRRCQCKPTPPLGKPQVECFPGICPKITERHLKPSPECPLPVLISPEDPILCPYVICNYSEETGKELESVSVVAMNNSAVRVRFTLPSLFVGLIGHAELYYTSDPTLPRHQWNVQKFARPKRLFDTANIEYHLGNLRPDTTYYFQVRILIEALHSGPESQVYKLYLPGPKSTTSGSQGFPLTATTVSLSQPSSSTLPPQIDMNVNLNAVPIDGNSIRLTWRKLDSHEKSLVDGITIKYRARDEIASDKWLTTPMIHRDVNEYTLRDLRPGMAYTVDLILKPVDGLPTQLITVRPVTVEIPSRPQDEYDFNPSIEVAPESYRTMMKLQGVPRPTDKYVNVVKVNFREANSEGLANKMVHMFKTPSEDGTIMVDGLSPNNRYKAWVDLYLANGNTVSTNTVTFTTKEDLKPPAIHDNRDNDPSANEAEALKESSSGEAIRPYYIALMIVAIFAIVTGIGFVTLLCVLMKTKTCAKAAITRAPSEAAYDNPTYKTYDGEKPGDEPVKNGST